MLGIVLDNNNNSNSINYLSPWKYNGNSIVSLINSIKVGIGTTSPSTNLHIVGDPLSNAANGSSGGGDFIRDAGSQHIVMDDIKIISKVIGTESLYSFKKEVMGMLRSEIITPLILGILQIFSMDQFRQVEL